ncbi:PREDICTED: tRNA dimethylallyltransferase, mitochondrial [Nicrophorus vespilloides]|uniref:tRNA dimethylallyltransferase, mitochondrial n=1 Tax=Nicrophorus vespilloides TaxID=110193 RepID=A0ABM1ML16_NICVS|nr:PREDICTED: tRNA dimethylallyltransferase, mitochondrial [Nicrophorus vespilloides]
MLRQVVSNMKLPLVVILGATGSGKTKLSIDLAKKFGGEILGADSIQIYKGMDIISAKPTVEERAEAPHHLVDILEPHETCTVLDYRNKALKIIDHLFDQKKIPIIVGGTNYYIESLLWKILVDDPNSKRKFEPGRSNKDYELPSEELHKKLKDLDPKMANRLHPNNKRKIIRSLEILEQKGMLHSEILNEQQKSEGGSAHGGGLRFSDVVIFWLQWDKPVLDERINSRVDAMMENGLVEELLDFHREYNKRRLQDGSDPDYTRGIFQMIGLKEFHEYLLLDECQRDSDEGKLLLQKGLDSLKMVTRRYARKQCRWINNRLLGDTGRTVPPVYGLTTDDLGKWQEDITDPAVGIIQSVIDGTECPCNPLRKISTQSTPNSQDETHFCEDCQRVFVGQHQWKKHLHSGRHKRAKDRTQRLMREKEEQSCAK